MPPNQQPPADDPNTLFRSYFTATSLRQKLDILDRLVEVDSLIAYFYLGYKAELLLKSGKLEEAVQAIEQGLEYKVEDDKLNFLKSQWLSITAQNTQDLQEALRVLDLASSYYDQKAIQDEVYRRFENMPDLMQWVRGHVDIKANMVALRSQVELLLQSTDLYNRMYQIESQSEKERVRSIEVLGIFAAILAFLITNVQLTANRISGTDILFFNAGLLIGLSWLLILISVLFTRPTEQIWGFKKMLYSGKFWIWMFSLSILAILFLAARLSNV